MNMVTMITTFLLGIIRLDLEVKKEKGMNEKKTGSSADDRGFPTHHAAEGLHGFQRGPIAQG